MVRRCERSAGWARSAAIALALDALAGDGPLRPHPVALFGSAMEHLEKLMWRDERVAGLAYALTGLLPAGAAGYILGILPGGSAIAGYVAIAGRGLWQAAHEVDDALRRG